MSKSAPQLDDLFTLITLEYQKAKKKYPRFCKRFLTKGENFDNIRWMLGLCRKISDNEKPRYSVQATLDEEVYEAYEAWCLNDLDGCLQELAQCGAVIIRAMEFINKQKEHEKCLKLKG